MKLPIRDVLNEYGINYEPANDGNSKVTCPFHEDSNPSGVIFAGTGVFHCIVCNFSTNFYRFLSKKLGKNVFYDVNSKFGEVSDKVITPETIENAHAAIWRPSSEILRKSLYYRGLADEEIRKYRLGVINDRISIPIRNAANFFVNLRLYKPNGGRDKFKNFPQFGKPTRLYPIDQLIYDTIVLCGGEIKALAAAKVLNPHNIGAISLTSGESTLIPLNLRSEFEGKKLYVCMDIDKVGMEAAEKHALNMQATVSWLGILTLPLDIEKYPHGDINDFIYAKRDLLKLIEETPQYEYIPIDSFSTTETPIAIELSKALSAKYTGKRIEVNAVVSTMETSPYSIPKVIQIKCDRSHTLCDQCPVARLPLDKQELILSKEHPVIIEMVGETKKLQKTALKEGLGIPMSCKVCSFTDSEKYSVEEVRISEALDLTQRRVGRTMQPAICVGEGIQLNQPYRMIGRPFPHPKTQQLILLFSEQVQTENALDSYECKNLDKLKIFQPKEWTVEELEKKLEEIYMEMETNVTFIYCRRDLHLVVDLAYFSPLFLDINKRLEKGWVEALVVGDTSQGKSQVSKNIMEYYGLGELVECKNATRAGILGGQESINKRYFITWGKVPLNDRQLVIFEELGGMPKDVFAKLTETRSSGIAQITGIAKGEQKTPARTRLIANSNPIHDRNMSDYNYGVDCLVELIGSRQDLRRFDVVIVVARDEVDRSEFSEVRPKMSSRYTSELSRELVLWSWTREKAIFEDENYLFKAVDPLYEQFSTDIPIVDTGGMRFKLGRLSAALAARTFSEKDGYVYVRKCHIDYMVKFLMYMYKKPNFGYWQYSQNMKSSESLVNEETIKNKILNDLPYAEEFIEHILQADYVDRFFFQDLLELDLETATKVLSFFIRQRALKRDSKKGYRKTKAFIDLLKELQKLDKEELPKFLKGEY